MLVGFRSNVAPRLHRTFFSPPSFLSFKQELQEYSERKVFQYDTRSITGKSILTFPNRYNPRQLFNVVSNVSQYPKFIPFCTDCRVLSTTKRPQENVPYSMEAELTAG